MRWVPSEQEVAIALDKMVRHLLVIVLEINLTKTETSGLREVTRSCGVRHVETSLLRWRTSCCIGPLLQPSKSHWLWILEESYSSFDTSTHLPSLNFVLPKTYGTKGCDFIWKQSFCRRDQVKMSRAGLQWALALRTAVLRRRERHTRGRRPRDKEGRVGVMQL